MATTDQVQDWIPEHVPPELAWDGDYHGFAAETDDPFLRVGELHAGPDILWTRQVGIGLGSSGGAGWLLTRQALMREVLFDTEHFVSGQTGMMSTIGIDWKLIPLEYNPPEHQLYRKVLEPFFSPASINALDGAVRQVCDELVEGFASRDHCEFIGEFAEKFPSHIFLDLMGMPRERLGDFLAWERGMLRPKTPEQGVEAMRAILDYLEGFVREQRKNPTSPLMKGIVSARYNDERELTETEILSTCYLLYIGGLDTVFSTIGWIFWHLAQDPSLQDRLRDNPEEIPRAVEELLRGFGAASTGRVVIKDLEFHGVQMRAGENVHCSLPLASRDPDAYDEPHRIDIDRDTLRHISFGTGTHTCLGLRLARRELKIVLESLLPRFANIRIPKGANHAFHTGSVFGVDRLPLEWELIGD
ncbi:MAG: cytochrome P450 [Novosphingobium sp.]|nr:cytochrome P450 [Novosphingobium sp.]